MILHVMPSGMKRPTATREGEPRARRHPLDRPVVKISSGKQCSCCGRMIEYFTCECGCS